MSEDITHTYYKAAWVVQHIFIEHLKGIPHAPLLSATDAPAHEEDARTLLYKVLLDIWIHYMYADEHGTDLSGELSYDDIVYYIRTEIRKQRAKARVGWERTPEQHLGDAIEMLKNHTLTVYDPGNWFHQKLELFLEELKWRKQHH